MSAITPADIKGRFPYAAGVLEPVIQGYIDSEEAYILKRLDLTTFPDDTVLRTVLQDLVISRIGFQLKSLSNEQLDLVSGYRREAKSRLSEYERHGWHRGPSTSLEEQVYSPSQMFSEEDFFG